MARTLICPTAILLSHKVLGHTKLYLEKAPVCWNPSMCMLNCLEGNRKLMDMILELGVDYSSNFWFRLLFQRSHNSQSQGFPSASVFTSHWSSSHAHPDFPVTPDLTHPMVQSQALVKSLWLPLTYSSLSIPLGHSELFHTCKMKVCPDWLNLLSSNSGALDFSKKP
jgi:hypothetical protein